MSRCLPIALSLVFFPASARAALDMEADKPYQLQLVLRIAPHPLLTGTDVFKKQIVRELRDNFQAALGNMAQVHVVDMLAGTKVKNSNRKAGNGLPADHQATLIEEVEAKGLERALDGWTEMSGTKTHFVLIDYVEGQYRIQTRQYDGFTGMASPVVRRMETTDRQFVPRLAALLIEQDFGLAGTIEQPARGDRVRVILKGGSLEVPLDRWVKENEVFAVTQILPASRGLRAYRLEAALLQVVEQPKNGVCVCRFFHRYKDPLSNPAVQGYRCLKLGTTEASLRVRVVTKDKEEAPIPAIRVVVNAHGFEGKPEEEKATNQEGFAQFEKKYTNVAFVQFYRNREFLARMPVEMMDERTIVCRVNLDKQADAIGQLRVQRDRLLGQMIDRLLAIAELMKQLSQFAQDRANDKALTAGQEGLDELTKDMDRFREEDERLKQGVKGHPLDLTEVEQRLHELESKRKELQGFVDDVNEVIKKENDPERQKLIQMALQAQLLESQFEFAKAMDLWRQVVAKGGNQPAFKKYADHLAELEKAWAVKSPAHAAARDFIYKTWRNLDAAAKVKAQIEEARKMFQVCRNVGDAMSPQMLLKTNVALLGKFRKELEGRSNDNSEDGRKTKEMLIEAVEGLRKLNEEVIAYLKQQRPAK